MMDQSVMFGQHVDSIINEPSPKISKILPDIDNLDLKEMKIQTDTGRPLFVYKWYKALNICFFTHD